MSKKDMVTVHVSGLREFHRDLKRFDVATRKKIIRTPLRKAMKPVLSRLKSNLESGRDTGGLLKTARISVLVSRKQLEKAGRANRKAIGVAQVGYGRARMKKDETGHQALQIEYGFRGSDPQSPLRNAVSGYEKDIISTLQKELKKAMARWLRRLAKGKL